MPIYEFYCEQCEGTFARLSSIEDRDLPMVCSFCGCAMKRKVSQGTGVIFKGSGWTPRNTLGSLAK